MSKYNEIMEHIEVTPEMKERLLKHIEEQSEGKPKRSIKLSKKFTYGSIAAAACLCLVIGVSMYINLLKTNSDSNHPEHLSEVTYRKEVYNSISELSKASGLPVKDIKDLPYDVTQTEYVYLCKTLAEIDYIGNENEVSLRVSKGIEDNSGIYEKYSITEDILVNGQEIAIKGFDDKRYLAVWTDGTYAYSIYVKQGVSIDEITNMIESME